MKHNPARVRVTAGRAGICTKLSRAHLVHLAGAMLILMATSPTARAQTYPSRPITMVVPTAAGGAMDTFARFMAERMQVSLGEPVIVESVGGANGRIGVGRVARATPDGYTLLVGNWNSQVANGVLYSLQYDLLKDFEPISLISSFPQLIVARSTIPANDLTGLIAWLKANPDQASEGIPGVGSIAHVSGVFFQNITGTRFQFVPYRGTAPAMQDLVAGRTDMMFDAPASSLPQVRAGRIKAYAVMSGDRLPAAPGIPTVDEAGLPGFHFSLWFGLWAPKGTPKDAIAKLNDAVVSTLADPVIRQKLTDQSMELLPREQQTPQALADFHKAEIEKWWPIIKAAGIKGE
jgi:tripartite-type tricarboxylate transporter receptor subunit TctC